MIEARELSEGRVATLTWKTEVGKGLQRCTTCKSRGEETSPEDETVELHCLNLRMRTRWRMREEREKRMKRLAKISL